MRLETDRLILRDWRDEDRAPFAALNADPEVMRYFPAVLSREQSDGLVNRIGEHFSEHGLGLCALEEKESGVFVGFTGFMRVGFACPIEGDLEIGWRLARQYWRKGLCFRGGIGVPQLDLGRPRNTADCLHDSRHQSAEPGCDGKKSV